MDRSLLIFLASGLAIERSFTTASTAISKAWLVGTGDTGGGGYWVWSGHARGLVWSGLVWSGLVCVLYPPPPPPPPDIAEDEQNSNTCSIFLTSLLFTLLWIFLFTFLNGQANKNVNGQRFSLVQALIRARCELPSKER